MSAPASVEPSVAGEVVKLARVEVKASRPDFEFDVQYDDVSTKVQGVLVTWVSPGTQKHGLRVGDLMASIDGKRVGDLTLQELLASTKRKLGSGESQVLVFTGTRMLVRRVSVTYTTRGPNKSLQPTRGSGLRFWMARLRSSGPFHSEKRLVRSSARG